MPVGSQDKSEVVLQYVVAGDALTVNHSTSDLGMGGQPSQKKRWSGGKNGAGTLWDGASGWVVRDCTAGAAKGGAKATILFVPSMEPDSQDENSPPMCTWSKPGLDGKFNESKTAEDAESVHVLMDRESFPADRLQPTAPYTFELPFAKLHYAEQNICLARLDVVPCKVAIDDKTSEELLAFLTSLCLKIAQRPGMRLHIVLDAENAAVPAMRHVKRLLAWSNGEGAELLFLSVRGFVTILKPKGLTGMALSQVLSFIQKVAPALWPEKVAATPQEADSFLSGLPVPASANCEDKVVAGLPSLPEGNSKATLSGMSGSQQDMAEAGSPVAQRDASPGAMSQDSIQKPEEVLQKQSGHSVDMPIIEPELDGNSKAQCASCGASCVIC